jgi:diguanylate cyclase (GGDEF)-like protein
MIVLAIVLFYGLRRGYVFDSGEKNFRLAVFFVLLLTFLDVFCYSFDARTGSSFYYYGNIFFNVLFFIVVPIPTYFYYLYARDFVDRPLSLKQKLLMGIPLVVNAGLAIASAFTPVIFTVTQFSNGQFINEYARTDWLALTFIVTFAYSFGAWLVVLLHKPRFSTTTIFIFSSLFLVPMIGTLIQGAVPIPENGAGISIGCASAAIAILIIFLFIVMRNTQTDSLTGLNNRKQFEECLRSVLKKRRQKNYLIGMMLDINKFKAINDTFGHREGDEALTYAARILKTAVGNSGFLARYAGDEFVVLIETDDQTEGQKIYGRVREQENALNQAIRKPYDLHFAVGYVTYTKNDLVSVDGFLDSIDKKMYADKRGLV